MPLPFRRKNRKDNNNSVSNDDGASPRNASAINSNDASNVGKGRGNRRRGNKMNSQRRNRHSSSTQQQHQQQHQQQQILDNLVEKTMTFYGDNERSTNEISLSKSIDRSNSSSKAPPTATSPAHTLSTLSSSESSSSSPALDESMESEGLPSSNEDAYDNRNKETTPSSTYLNSHPTNESEKDGNNKDDSDSEEEPKSISQSLIQSNHHQIGQSVYIWMSDMNELLTSTVFQNAIQSTLSLGTTLSKSMIQATLYPLIKPIQFTTSMIQSSLALVQQSTFALTNNILFGQSQNHSYPKTIPHNAQRQKKKDDDDDDDDEVARTTTIQEKVNNHELSHPGISSLYQTTQGFIGTSLSLFFGALASSSSSSPVNRGEDKGDHSNHESEYHFQVMDEIEEDDSHDYIPLVYDDDENNHDNRKKMRDVKGEENDKSLFSSCCLHNEQHLVITSSLPDQNMDNHIKIGTMDDAKEEAQQSHDEETHDTVMEECCKSLPPSTTEADAMIFCIRVSDLGISSSKSIQSESSNDIASENGNNVDDNEEKKEEITKSNSASQKIVVLQLKLPTSLVSDLNARATIIDAMNTMVAMGLDLILNVNGEISWQEEGATTKLLKRLKANLAKEAEPWFDNSTSMDVLEKEVLLWSGGRKTKKSSSYAPNIPMFRGRGILPAIGAKELTELLLDSSKVNLYNKWSKGRNDLAVYQDDLGALDNLYGNGALKVVENETKIPFSNNSIKMVTLLHARPITLTNSTLDDFCTTVESKEPSERSGYIMVSRTVSKVVGTSEGMKHDQDITSCTDVQNEIIWGVNVILDVPKHDGKTEMITLTQAKSNAVPGFLVHKVGLTGAGDFFKNIRNIEYKQ